MKKKMFLLLSVCYIAHANAQDESQDFKIVEINKPVKDFSPPNDCSSPLRSYLYFTNNILIDGKNKLLRTSSTTINRYLFPDNDAPDSKISEKQKNYYLNSSIKEVITYKDSISYVLSCNDQSFYSIRCFFLENNKWLNAGEDGRRGLENARQFAHQFAAKEITRLRRYYELSKVPTDTSAFVQYLKNSSQPPKQFLMQKLKGHKLVIYGEIHHRKASWDFLKAVTNEKKFALTAGTVFLELPSHKQRQMNLFLKKNKIDQELLLDIFREAQFDGWNDKGMFDFIVNIWNINQHLQKAKRIKIILIDTPRPYSALKSEEDLRNSERGYNRDSFMAKTVIKYLSASKDKRHALFIVGTAHVAKTLSSAGSILSNEMNGKCYTIFTHAPQVDNWTHIPERIRHGMFDYSFYAMGDDPLAFDLKDSPFGKEPCDGLYYEAIGSFSNNYDGYIFLCPLDKEPNGEILTELFSDEFVQELDRRYHLSGSSLVEEWHLKELSRNEVLQALFSDHTKTRFSYLKPMIESKKPN